MLGLLTPRRFTSGWLSVNLEFAAWAESLAQPLIAGEQRCAIRLSGDYIGRIEGCHVREQLPDSRKKWMDVNAFEEADSEREDYAISDLLALPTLGESPAYGKALKIEESRHDPSRAVFESSAYHRARPRGLGEGLNVGGGIKNDCVSRH